MSRTVALYPWVDDVGVAEGGIARVIEGQISALAEVGWEPITDPAKADIVNVHVEIPPAWLRNFGRKPFVVSNHGLYWSEYQWEANWHYAVNVRALDAIRCADVVTAPSEWVANAIRRASMRDVRAIHHGIDAAPWTVPEQRGKYCLWNKSRPDPICDPRPPRELAELLPEVPFVTTFGHGNTPPNMRVTGNLPFAEARKWIEGAGAYLSTTRETFGVGTLEALACGVPVVGWRWGGNTEILTHGVDSWLADPGDVEGLVEGVRWALSDADRAACRATAERFTLRAAAERYAEAYEDAYDRRRRFLGVVPAGEPIPPKVSVVVPAYGLADYLPDCLDSLLVQTFKDWECVVVDDASPDRSAEIVREYAERDPRFRLVRHAENRYLAAARNTGMSVARGEYLVPLDSDDMLAPSALAQLAGALDGDRGLHIAYGNVLFVDEDGRTPSRAVTGRGQSPGHSGWPFPFDLELMMRGPGQLIPVCSMYRREVWERTGGYRERCRSSEDQDFWLRATSYGFVAQMVTQDDTLIYRRRETSMSATEGWEDHRGWYPWAGDGDRALLPAASYREGIPASHVAVPTHDPPFVAVVIPVGPGHGQYVLDAVDSVDAQTFRMWECIVVRDCPEQLPRLPSWVRIVCSDATCPCRDGDPCHYSGADAWELRPRGVAAARNAGIAASRARTFLPLDADDYLQPRALELMWRAYAEDPERPIVYSDFWQDRGGGDVRVHHCDDYDPTLVLGRSRTFEGERRTGMLHAVTALTPRAYWEEVGGYDETLPAWEDWAFEIAVAAKGHCERRVAAPLFTYRMAVGMRRESDLGAFDESKAAIMAKDFGLGPGGELMACRSCRGGRQTTSFPVPSGGSNGALTKPSDGEAVLVRYTGNKAGSIRYNSHVASGVAPYTFSASRREVYVRAGDVDWLTAHPDFAVAEPAPVAAGVATATAPASPAVVAARTPTPAPTVPFTLEESPAPPVAEPAPTQTDPEPQDTQPDQPVSEFDSPDDDEGSDGLPPAAQALMTNTRADLERMARNEGLSDPEDRSVYRTKADLARVIAAKRSLGF